MDDADGDQVTYRSDKTAGPTAGTVTVDPLTCPHCQGVMRVGTDSVNAGLPYHSWRPNSEIQLGVWAILAGFHGAVG